MGNVLNLDTIDAIEAKDPSTIETDKALMVTVEGLSQESFDTKKGVGMRFAVETSEGGFSLASFGTDYESTLKKSLGVIKGAKASGKEIAIWVTGGDFTRCYTGETLAGVTKIAALAKASMGRTPQAIKNQTTTEPKASKKPVVA